MTLVSSIIEAIIVFGLMAVIVHLFDDVDDVEAEIPSMTEEYVIPGVIAVVVGAINYFSNFLQEDSLKWAPLLLAVMVAVILYLVYWWHKKGSEWKEMIPFILVLIPIGFTTRQCAWATSSLIQNDLAASVVCTLPSILSVLAVGFIVFDFFYFRFSEVDEFETETSEEARENLRAKGKHKALMIVTSIVTALALCVCCAEGLDFNKATTNAGLDTSVLDGVYAASGDEIGSVTLDTWNGVHFYHYDVLEDSSEKNDWNNGPKAKGKDELISRLSKDPALLAQLMLAYDYTVNTDFIGQVIYADYNQKWTVLDQVDAATRIMASKEGVFNAGNDAIIKMINGASSVKREKRRVYDQVFMHSNTIDGIPSTVVFESNVKEAWCLVLTYNFKDNTPAVEIVLREACGYQWCNGASTIGVTPKSYPTGTGSPGKKSKSHKDKASKPSKKPSGTGDNPSGPSYNKDPNKAPTKDTEPNDDPGPGPNTNNPKDPNHSTEDKPSNSDHMTYDQYKDKVEQNRDANKPSGGSSSGGSSSGGSTHRNDNSSGGTGNGGIDKPTPSSKPATTGGKPVNDSGAGDSWEGPSD